MIEADSFAAGAAIPLFDVEKQCRQDRYLIAKMIFTQLVRLPAFDNRRSGIGIALSDSPARCLSDRRRALQRKKT